MLTVIISVFLLISFSIYFIRNRKAVEKLLRGYGAYDIYSMHRWVEEAKQFELSDINETCIVYELT